MYIDDVFRGHPTYNQFRVDIFTLFPGYANSGGAVGAFTFDSTTLANGVHTIAWGVADNAGHVSGVGSRFLTVANGAGSTAAETSIGASPPIATRRGDPTASHTTRLVRPRPLTSARARRDPALRRD